MILRIEKKDLFDVDESKWILGHCVSSDFVLGAGIAVEFVNRFNAREGLKRSYPDYNFVKDGPKTLMLMPSIVSSRRYLIANIVSKDRVYEKPTYENLKKALYDLKNEIAELKEDVDKLESEVLRTLFSKMFSKVDAECRFMGSYWTHLAIPRIGCGIDGLEWTKVQDILIEVFGDTNMTILVCDPFMDKSEEDVYDVLTLNQMMRSDI